MLTPRIARLHNQRRYKYLLLFLFLLLLLFLLPLLPRLVSFPSFVDALRFTSAPRHSPCIRSRDFNFVSCHFVRQYFRGLSRCVRYFVIFLLLRILRFMLRFIFICSFSVLSFFLFFEYSTIICRVFFYIVEQLIL